MLPLPASVAYGPTLCTDFEYYEFGAHSRPEQKVISLVPID
jgi:hypothetical protein